MTDLTFGKGVFIWRPRSIDRGDPKAIASRFEKAGVQTAVIRIADGSRVLGGLDKLVTTLRDRGIRVGAWGRSQLHRAPQKEARVVLQACDRYQPDFYLVMVQPGAGRNRRAVRAFFGEIKSAGADVALGLGPAADPARNGDFAWGDLLGTMDFVSPLINCRGIDPVGRLISTRQAFTAVPNAPELPMPAVVVDMLSARGRQVPPTRVSNFLEAADGDPFLRGVLMCAPDGAAFTPELWDAFAEYVWKGPSRTIPSQPLGWGKVKAPGGLWIHSMPDGERVGGLALGELTPIWAVAETRWAALNQAADHWIFIGDPDAVSTTLDGSAARTLPSSGLELYQARVAARRGLNVRDSVRGRVLRVLPVNSVVRVYEDHDGWARINPANAEWVQASFLSRVTA